MFWEMHDTLFWHQDALTDVDVRRYAGHLGVSSPIGEGRSGAGHEYSDHIEADIAGGVWGGAGGSPSIFINGYRHRGGYDQATLVRAIELAKERVRRGMRPWRTQR